MQQQQGERRLPNLPEGRKTRRVIQRVLGIGEKKMPDKVYRAQARPPMRRHMIAPENDLEYIQICYYGAEKGVSGDMQVVWHFRRTPSEGRASVVWVWHRELRDDQAQKKLPAAAQEYLRNRLGQEAGAISIATCQ